MSPGFFLAAIIPDSPDTCARINRFAFDAKTQQSTMPRLTALICGVESALNEFNHPRGKAARG
jgi:hypothetical protein